MRSWPALPVDDHAPVRLHELLQRRRIFEPPDHDICNRHRRLSCGHRDTGTLAPSLIETGADVPLGCRGTDSWLSRCCPAVPQVRNLAVSLGVGWRRSVGGLSRVVSRTLGQRDKMACPATPLDVPLFVPLGPTHFPPSVSHAHLLQIPTRPSSCSLVTARMNALRCAAGLSESVTEPSYACRRQRSISVTRACGGM
jgi:hypothetical protein